MLKRRSISVRRDLSSGTLSSSAIRLQLECYNQTDTSHRGLPVRITCVHIIKTLSGDNTLKDKIDRFGNNRLFNDE